MVVINNEPKECPDCASAYEIYFNPNANPDENDIVYRLEKRAAIRYNIPTRKSVQEGKPDRIAELLIEAAAEIRHLRETK